MSEIHTLDEVIDEEPAPGGDGVGQTLSHAGGEAVAEGKNAATPFVLLAEVMAVIAVICAVIMTLTFLIPYLTTGHWPY